MGTNGRGILAGARQRSQRGDEFRLIRRLAVLAALGLVLGLAFVSTRAPAPGLWTPPNRRRESRRA